jgi:hypothetical protein
MSSMFTSRMRRPGADAEPPPEASARPVRRVWSILPICAGFAVFGAIVWLAYQDVSLGPPIGEAPLIKAAPEPIKLPPEQAQEPTLAAEQGAVGRLWSDAGQDDQPERLLPPPEQPLSPPEIAAPANPEQALQGSGAQPPSEAAAPQPPSEAMAAAAETGADRAGNDTAVAAGSAAPAGAPDSASLQNPSDESLQEAEAALDRLLAEVTASAESASTPGSSTASADQGAVEVPAAPEESPAGEPAVTAAAQPSDQAAVEGPPVREERPAAEPAVTTAAPAPPERALPTVPPQKPAPAAVAVAPSTTTEVRPASALTGAPVSAARAPARSSEGAAPSRAAAPIATPTVAADGEFRIQLAAVRGEADARRAWSLFMGDLGPVLSDIKPIFERADTANGVFYRVQIGPFANQQAAESLCEELKQRNASCFVIRR